MMPLKYCILRHIRRKSGILLTTTLNRQLGPTVNIIHNRGKSDDSKNKSIESVDTFLHPLSSNSKRSNVNVGVELTGNLNKFEVQRILNQFMLDKHIEVISKQYGLNDFLLSESLRSFRQYCLNIQSLPADLHVLLNDITQGGAHVTDLLPYFMQHARQIFPHIECIDDLKKISDMRSPANWYPAARAKPRKIIFHVGPTNSGKTYNALKRYMTAKSGVYCGPLKLLAVEVFHKCNNEGTPCDLVTGDEKRFAVDEEHPANHVACSVEMVNISNHYEVAVIDEIQLMRDHSRGWAWTRALLGIPADEIHLCGENAAVELVKSLCLTTGEDVEIHKYKRLSSLTIENTALRSFDRVQPGDCIVCFNKNDIFSVSRAIEERGKEVAVIYGSLPPGTKLAQVAKFNDPMQSCKVLVATNAIGMGLNLHIRRIIFFSLTQPTINEKGEKEIDLISVSSALQIAGRAGRYKTAFEKGYVTTFRACDLPVLKNLLNSTPEELTQAGLLPTADQIELYAYHLPKTPLSRLMDIFLSLSKVDDTLYFMCDTKIFKFLADMIEHIPLPLRARYSFCCAPIDKKTPYVCTMFLKFVRQYSKNEKISFEWLSERIGWPFALPRNLVDLVHLEAVFDVLDLYLWLSYRFDDLFPDRTRVRAAQEELDRLIQCGVVNLMALLKREEREKQADKEEISIPMENMVLQKHLQRVSPAKNTTFGRGRLTERLLTQGLITPEILQELQREWRKLNKKK